MKTLRYFYLAAISLTLFAACSDDNDDIKSLDEVPVAAQTRVATDYPNLTVEWEREDGMLKAEVTTLDGTDVDLWFSTDGTWLATETDNVGTLPEAVKSYVTTNYADYTIDDVDLWETTSGTIYEVELDHRTKADITLWLTADGTLTQAPLASEYQDRDITNLNEVPAAAQERVAADYPNLTVEWEVERGLLKAEVKTLNGTDVDLWFTTDGTWIATETDNVGALPEAVSSYITANYADYTVDDVDLWETTSGTIYEVELEHRTKADVDLWLTADGTLTQSPI